MVGNSVVQLLDLVLQSATLSLRDLLHVLLRLDLLVLGVDQALSVDQLHLDTLEMLGQDLESLLMFLDLESKLCHQSYFLSYL